MQGVQARGQRVQHATMQAVTVTNAAADDFRAVYINECANYWTMHTLLTLAIQWSPLICATATQ